MNIKWNIKWGLTPFNSWLPRSLLWRTFVIIAVLLLVSVLAWVQLFRFYEREPRARQISQQIIAILNLTRARRW